MNHASKITLVIDIHNFKPQNRLFCEIADDFVDANTTVEFIGLELGKLSD